MTLMNLYSAMKTAVHQPALLTIVLEKYVEWLKSTQSLLMISDVLLPLKCLITVCLLKSLEIIWATLTLILPGDISMITTIQPCDGFW
jgi:hypothetical protein